MVLCWPAPDRPRGSVLVEPCAGRGGEIWPAAPEGSSSRRPTSPVRCLGGLLILVGVTMAVVAKIKQKSEEFNDQ